MKFLFSAISLSLSVLGMSLLAPTAQAAKINADFSGLTSGSSVEGLGTVHELLNISSSTGGAKAIFAGTGAGAYGASSDPVKANSNIRNGGIGALGGFADLDGKREHVFDFTFAEGVSVENFSLRMLDYGDFNKSRATNHSILLTALNSQKEVVDEFVFSYESSKALNPIGLYKGGGRGDALMASEGDPGLLTLSVSGADITAVQLKYQNNGNRANIAGDPNIGFDTLTFETAETEDVPEPMLLLGLVTVGALGLSRTRQQS